MAFRIPTFNLTANVWRSTSLLTNPPDLVLPCQLRAVGNRSTSFDVRSGTTNGANWLSLFPLRSDVRDGYNTGLLDIVEIPAGTSRFYSVVEVDDVARGFPNEYRIAFLQKAGAWPVPIP